MIENEVGEKEQKTLNVTEHQGFLRTPEHSYSLNHDDNDVDLSEVEQTTDGIEFKGYLGVCGILTLRSETGSVEMLLHGYFPSSLKILANEVIKIFPKDTPRVYTARLHVPKDKSDRARRYEEISNEFLQAVGIHSALEIVQHERGAVDISV